MQEYETFSLPYCSRCTRVIVDAVNDIINMAEKMGFLKNRINKSYYYFEDEIKDKESNQYSKVVYSQLFAKKIPWFIEKQISEIAKEIKDNFSVLIISPTRIQARDIVKAIKKKGFENIEFVQKKDVKEPTLMDGLKILMDDKKSNLGWRIVSKVILGEKDFISIIKETYKDGANRIPEIIDNNCKKEVTGMTKNSPSIKK